MIFGILAMLIILIMESLAMKLVIFRMMVHLESLG